MAARQLLASLLAVVAGFAAMLGVGAWYLSHEVVERAAFADRALVALDQEPVHDAVRDELTAQVLARVPDVPILRLRLAQTVDTVIATPEFRRAFRRGAADVNRVLFSDDRDDAALQLDITGPLAQADPRLAAALPRGLETRLLRLRTESLGVGTRRAADAIDAAAVALPVVAVVALVLALLVAGDRRRALRLAALTTVLAGVLLLAALALGRGVALDRVQAGAALSRDEARAAAEAAVGVYGDDLRTRVLVGIGAGVVVFVATLLPGRSRRRERAGG